MKRWPGLLRAARGALCGCVLIGFGAGLIGCDRLPLDNDLDEAGAAARAGEWGLAQKLLERYLRDEGSGEDRWKAWIMLLEVSARANPDSPWLVDYLETMLLEFEDSGERVRDILNRLALAHEARGRLDRAADVWARLIDEPDLAPDDNAATHRRLARIHIRQRRFAEADNVLQNCLTLDASSVRQAECLYDLADLASTREEFDNAALMARQVMELDGVDPALHARAGFILGDALEQLGKRDEALAVFTAIRNVYPNDRVIDTRIAHLKKPVRKDGTAKK